MPKIYLDDKKRIVVDFMSEKEMILCKNAIHSAFLDAECDPKEFFDTSFIERDTALCIASTKEKGQYGTYIARNQEIAIALPNGVKDIFYKHTGIKPGYHTTEFGGSQSNTVYFKPECIHFEPECIHFYTDDISPAKAMELLKKYEKDLMILQETVYACMSLRLEPEYKMIFNKHEDLSIPEDLLYCPGLSRSAAEVAPNLLSALFAIATKAKFHTMSYKSFGTHILESDDPKEVIRNIISYNKTYSNTPCFWKVVPHYLINEKATHDMQESGERLMDLRTELNQLLGDLGDLSLM